MYFLCAFTNRLILDDSQYSYSQINIKEPYVELIIRSMEFKAAGIDEDGSFNELD